MRRRAIQTRGAAAIFAIATTGALAGCRQDMHDQPKFIPQRGTSFFADGRSARPQVENTVARGQLRENAYFYTGMRNGQEGNAMPFPVNEQVLERGQERYNVFCTPCHSRVGNGEGLIVLRGYRPAGNFHTQRLLNAPLGHFFHVMTNGYGAMPEYATQIPAQDRWAIVVYIKSLQLSQHAQASDAPAGARFEPVEEIAQREGLAADTAKDWRLPTTAVYGTPDNQDHGIPQLASPNDKSAIGEAAPRATEKTTTPEVNGRPAAASPTPRAVRQ